VRCDLVDGHYGQPGWQRGEHYDQAHGLVEDHRLQGCEPEQPDQQRQPELRATQADQPTEQPDGSSGQEHHARMAADRARRIGRSAPQRHHAVKPALLPTARVRRKPGDPVRSAPQAQRDDLEQAE
jgi:hypothetical protein